MFTIDQIQESSSRLKRSTDLPLFIQELAQIGVTGYRLFLRDREAEYFGKHNASLKADGNYPTYDIALRCDQQRFKNIMTAYTGGKLACISFYEQLARVGVEMLAVDTAKFTCTYYNIDGEELLVEHMEKPAKKAVVRTRRKVAVADMAAPVL